MTADQPAPTAETGASSVRVTEDICALCDRDHDPDEHFLPVREGHLMKSPIPPSGSQAPAVALGAAAGVSGAVQARRALPSTLTVTPNEEDLFLAVRRKSGQCVIARALWRELALQGYWVRNLDVMYDHAIVNNVYYAHDGGTIVGIFDQSDRNPVYGPICLYPVTFTERHRFGR